MSLAPDNGRAGGCRPDQNGGVMRWEDLKNSQSRQLIGDFYLYQKLLAETPMGALLPDGAARYHSYNRNCRYQLAELTLTIGGLCGYCIHDTAARNNPRGYPPELMEPFHNVTTLRQAVLVLNRAEDRLEAVLPPENLEQQVADWLAGQPQPWQ